MTITKKIEIELEKAIEENITYSKCKRSIFSDSPGGLQPKLRLKRTCKAS